MKTRLKEARRSSGLSQQDACERLGVSLGTYRNWEQGRVVMNGEQLISAARLYNTTVDFLLMTDTNYVEDDKEDELVDLFRSLSEDSKEAVLVVAKTLAKHASSREVARSTTDE